MSGLDEVEELPKDWNGFCPRCKGHQFMFSQSANRGILNSRRIYDVKCDNGSYDCGYQFKVVIL